MGFLVHINPATLQRQLKQALCWTIAHSQKTQSTSVTFLVKISAGFKVPLIHSRRTSPEAILDLIH